MPLRYYPAGDLDELSAIETVLACFEDDVVKQQEVAAWLHELVDAAGFARAVQDEGLSRVEEALWPDDDTHHCTPTCEGGCADVRRQAVATCEITFPALGGASIVT